MWPRSPEWTLTEPSWAVVIGEGQSKGVFLEEVTLELSPIGP